MVNLRKAELKEAQKILEFYRNVIDSIEGSEFKPKWGKHYPNLVYIELSIEKEELYICTEHDNIIASVVLNSRFDPDYENIEWIVDASPEEITIVHTFAVATNFTGKGIGKEIFNKIKDMSIKHNQKSIRVDIIDGNEGARKVFEKFGFKYVNSIEIFHEAVGLEKFHLYELDLINEN